MVGTPASPASLGVMSPPKAGGLLGGCDFGDTPTLVLPTDWGGEGTLQHRERVPCQGQAAVLEHGAGPRAPAPRCSRDAAQGLRVLRVSGRRGWCTHSPGTTWAPAAARGWAAASGAAPTPARRLPELLGQWQPGWPPTPRPAHTCPRGLPGVHEASAFPASCSPTAVGRLREAADQSAWHFKNIWLEEGPGHWLYLKTRVGDRGAPEPSLGAWTAPSGTIADPRGVLCLGGGAAGSCFSHGEGRGSDRLGPQEEPLLGEGAG